MLLFVSHLHHYWTLAHAVIHHYWTLTHDAYLQEAFLTGRTPLILDTSPDNKLSTYLSYQPNVVLLEVTYCIE